MQAGSNVRLFRMKEKRYERIYLQFRGFAACLDGAVEKGVIYGKGVYEKGSVQGKKVMREAYEMGKTV